jgi:ABC-type microcin C transport system permease subunit YejE
MFVLGYAYARRRAPWWSALSVASGAAFVTLFVLTNLGFGQDPAFVGIGGLLQRLTVGVGWLWLTLVAAREVRRS